MVIKALALVGAYRFPLDKRATFLRTLQKFSPLIIALSVLFQLMEMEHFQLITPNEQFNTWVRSKIACLCMSLAAGVAGPGRVAELPCIGSWLLSPEICHCQRRAKLSEVNLSKVDADAKAIGEIVDACLHHQVSKTSEDRAEEEAVRV